MSAEIEIIDGESRELVVQEPQRLSAMAPEDTIGLASRMATMLADIVERQRLFAVIQGKKYPQVEAWMTIARMDNVVAREAATPIRHDDGSYEAFVELIRLSDGMVVGAGSALCGTPDDNPWASRSEPARRSMAVTRATSRAFRQQYSWIMALAGYEPTPAEEMPHDREERPVAPRNVTPRGDGGLTGKAEAHKAPADYELRETPDGPSISFRLASVQGNVKVVATGDLASALALVRSDVLGHEVTCWGVVTTETFTPKDTTRKIPYQVMALEKIQTPELVLPARPTVPVVTPEAAGAPSTPETANPSPGTSAADDAEIDALVF